MLINIKGQVEVKVKKGTKELVGDAMMAELSKRMGQVLRDFMAEQPNVALYTMEVKEGTTTIRF